MIIDEIKKSNMVALKSHDNASRTAYSIVMNKYKLAEIEKRSKGEEIADVDMVAIIQKTIKMPTKNCLIILQKKPKKKTCV